MAWCKGLTSGWIAIFRHDEKQPAGRVIRYAIFGIDLDLVHLFKDKLVGIIHHINRRRNQHELVMNYGGPKGRTMRIAEKDNSANVYKFPVKARIVGIVKDLKGEVDVLVGLRGPTVSEFTQADVIWDDYCFRIRCDAADEVTTVDGRCQYSLDCVLVGEVTEGFSHGHGERVIMGVDDSTCNKKYHKLCHPNSNTLSKL